MPHLSITEKPKFINWLQERGCEILPTSNQYEELRFKGKETGVLYKSGKTNSDYTDKAISSFRNNKKWNGRPVKTGRHAGYKKEKEKLIDRDGTKCFFCHKELGEDITVEHLISLTSGGKNNLSNMVLAHQKCNENASTFPVYKKMQIALKNKQL